MQLESHLAVGWLMANLVPGNDRRFRFLVTFSALAPDLDGLPYLFGPDAYAHSHHVYGHNIFFGLLVAGICTCFANPGWRKMTCLFTLLGFATHWVGDYYCSGWPLMTFWPVSRDEVMYRPRIGLDHPINRVLSFSSLLFFLISPIFWKRTIFEIFWPSLDRLLVGLTRPRTLRCATCQRKTAQQCSNCQKALCLRHAKISGSMRVICAECVPSPRPISHR